MALNLENIFWSLGVRGGNTQSISQYDFYYGVEWSDSTFTYNQYDFFKKAGFDSRYDFFTTYAESEKAFYENVDDSNIYNFRTFYENAGAYLGLTSGGGGATPSVSFTVDDSTLGINQVVTFTDTSTNTPTAWSWGFGDGTGVSSVQNPTYSYSSVGTYIITLTASNAFGTASGTGSVTVGLGPTSSFTIDDTTLLPGQVMTLTDTSTESPNAWSYDFGDGDSSSLQNPTHSYASVGDYVITLTASNDFAEGTGYTASVEVGLAPTASFTTSTQSTTTGETITFTDTSTETPTSWLWDFNDGTTSSVQNPTHQYSATGSFVVGMTATNAFGSDYATASIEISGAQSLLSQLESYWDADSANGFSDRTGYNDAIPVNSATVSTSGFVDDTYTFNGTNQYLQTSTNSTVTQFSVNYWINRDLASDGTGQQSFGKNTVSETVVMTIVPRSDGNTTLSFGLGDGTNSVTLLDNTSFFTETWYMITGVYDGSTLSLYRDGSFLTSSSISSTLTDIDLYIGARNLGGSATGYTDGKIDEFAWFDQPLSQDDIDFLYNSGNGLNYEETVGMSPTASFTLSNENPNTDVVVTFTDTTTGGPREWLWDFGNGATSSSQSPTYSYGATGSYVVGLTVSNYHGSSYATASIEVTKGIIIQSIGASSDYVFTSYDGVSWATQSKETGKTVEVLGIGATAFVFPEQGNYAFKTTDGINYATFSIPSDGTSTNYLGACYAEDINTIVVVGGITGKFTNYSTDGGQTWATASIPGSNTRFDSVVYGGGTFAAVSINALGTDVMTSNDGINWTSRTTDGVNWWGDIDYQPGEQGNPGTFAAVSFNGGTTDRVMTSNDGITWTNRTTTNKQWTRLAYSDKLKLWVSVAAQETTDCVMTSTDAITWTTQSPFPTYKWEFIEWIPQLELFVVSSSETSSETHDRIMTSPDGFNWTLRDTPVDTVNLRKSGFLKSVSGI